MSADIIIFDTEIEEEKEEQVRDEITIFYENLLKTQLITHGQRLSFNELESKNSGYVVDSTIDSIILEQLLPHTIPILYEIPPLDMKRKTVAKVSKLSKVSKTKSVMREEKTDAYIVNLQTPYHVTCMYRNKYIEIPMNS